MLNAPVWCCLGNTQLLEALLYCIPWRWGAGREACLPAYIHLRKRETSNSCIPGTGGGGSSLHPGE